MPPSVSFEADWVSPPGEAIEDLLEQRGLSVSNLASQLGRSEVYIQALLQGSEILSKDVALSLEHSIGGSAQFWLNRELQYRRDLAALQSTGPPMGDDEFLDALPIKEMVACGWIPRTRSTRESVASCLAFFDVPNIGAWQSRYFESKAIAAFRTSPTFEPKKGSVSAWIRWGEIQAASAACQPWKADRFQGELANIRRLTRIKDPAAFLPRLQDVCQSCGVAVVVARAPAGCRASGAARFLSSRRAMILLSFRHLTDDHFWFSFFHEAGHLLLHDESQVFIDGEDESALLEEQQANDFAADCLIDSWQRSILNNIDLNSRSIIRFALRAGVAPGIVVGQLQHNGRVRPNQLNSLKRRYKWS
jgi:HTH-type transcriptional regulator / antitoxin HigA